MCVSNSAWMLCRMERGVEGADVGVEAGRSHLVQIAEVAKRMPGPATYSTSFSDALASSTRSSSRNCGTAFDWVSNTIVVRSGTV